jgi:hypothetical protein
MRRRWMMTLGLVGCGWVAFELVWIASGKPAADVDYNLKLETLTASHQPEGENGWPLLVDTANLAEQTIIRVRDGMRPDLSLILDRPSGTATTWAAELELIDALRADGVLDRLATLAETRRFVRPTGDPTLYEGVWADLNRIRELSRIRAATMRLAFVDDDPDEAVASLEQSLAVVRSMGAQPLVFDRMMAAWAAGVPLAQLEHGLIEHDLDVATCMALLDALDRQMRLAPAELMFEAQRLGALQQIEHSFTDDGHGDGRLDVGSTGLPLLNGMGLAGRRETTRLINEYADGLIENARQRPAVRLATPAFDVDAFVATLDFRHDFVRFTIGQTATILDASEDLAARVEATRIMLALAAYRAEHGDYPEKLAELTPRYLAKPPVDPTHGGTFVYDRGPARGDLPFLLYSIGVDATDDTVGLAPAAIASGSSFGPGVSIQGSDRLFDPRRPQSSEDR